MECVEGKPYSSAVDPDIVILWSGGESGRGKQSISLITPLKKTPAAKMWTSLPIVSQNAMTPYNEDVEGIAEESQWTFC